MKLMPKPPAKSRKPSGKKKPVKRVGIHPAMLSEDSLMKKCELTFGRTSGPGGQHRNKVETAVTVKHLPTEIIASASERRHQSQNRHEAIFRLRMRLARKIRRPIHREFYKPTELWQQRRQGTKMSVNPGHADYPSLLAEALDVVMVRGCDVAGSAGILGISMSQLAKLIRNDKASFAKVNEGRVERGLKPLR